jgi:putative endonuclease
MSWCLYLLECADGSYYAGITNDLENRIKAHNDGLGAKYTRGRGPVKLLAQQDFENRSEASKAESAIKKLPKSQKLGFFA